MKKFLFVTAACMGVLCTTPAQSAVLACSSGPSIDLINVGCTAGGNDALNNVEAALAAATGIDVSLLQLSLYGKSDDNKSLFSFLPDANPAMGKATDWSVLDGTPIKYVTVKGSTSFKLYELPKAGASSGINFSTLGILNRGGNQPDISHLSFWTSPTTAVPEASTWAMMLLGIGASGFALRRRQTAPKPRLNAV